MQFLELPDDVIDVILGQIAEKTSVVPLSLVNIDEKKFLCSHRLGIEKVQYDCSHKSNILGESFITSMVFLCGRRFILVLRINCFLRWMRRNSTST